MIRCTILLIILLIALSACTLSYQMVDEQELVSLTPSELTAENTDDPLPEDVIPPYTPLPTLTPSRTLLPPPTFEPPTLTPLPSLPPTETIAPTLALNTSLEDFHGNETPSPTATIVCAPRDDWGGSYTIQPGDYLFNLAQRFHTTVDEIAAANCLRNINILSVGTVIKVPGTVGGSGVECVPWEVLTPLNGMESVPGTGQITFNWRGPRAERNLIRIYKPDGGIFERVVDLRQNETIDLSELPLAGIYRWYVYPLDQNYRQIECLEGGPWTFAKAAAPPTAAVGVPMTG